MALPEIIVLKGTPASNPVAPALTNNNMVRQISLAAIRIPAGSTAINAAMITDERLDASVCGIVTEKVGVDTSMMKAQFDAFWVNNIADFEAYMAAQKAAWEHFFADVSEDSVLPVPSLDDKGKALVVNESGDGFTLGDAQMNIPVTPDVPEDSDIWIDPNGETVEDSHMADTNNPHKVSLAQTGGSNSNLLDNWYFGNPVNQRGATEYTASGFTLDRWRLELKSTVSPYFAVGDGCVVLHNETATGTPCSCFITQAIDKPMRFSGKKITFSVKFKSVESLSNAIIKIRSSGGNSSTKYVGVSDANSIVSVSMTLGSAITSLDVCIGSMMSFGGDGSMHLEIESAKLEIGAISTLANDAPPKFSEQLLECQRYYVRYAGGGQWLIGASNGTTLYVPLRLPVPLRAFPDTSPGKNGFVYANVNIYPYVSGGKVEITSLSLANASGTQDFMLYANHASNELAAKQPGCIRFTTGGYVALSAEI